MNELFRNIYQKLLKEGKTTNYLKYDIGEIVPVVIKFFVPKFKNENGFFPSTEGIKGWV